HRDRILRAELEDMPDLQRLEDFKRAALAIRTTLARCDRAQVGPTVGAYVALDVHAAQVVIVLVRAGCHIVTACKCVIGDNFKIASNSPRPMCSSCHCSTSSPCECPRRET